MNTRRLKFAFARGARIVRLHRHSDEELDPQNWSGQVFIGEFPDFHSSVLPLVRIHPADARLEYGPLSSALRERVMRGANPVMGMVAMDIAHRLYGVEVGVGATADDHYLHALFAAELLADEGL